jgi:hypothetical protein
VQPALPVRSVTPEYGRSTGALAKDGRVSSGALHASRTSAGICASVNAFQLVHQTASAAATERE